MILKHDQLKVLFSFYSCVDEIQISAGVIGAWGYTIYRQFELLAGKSAPHDFIKLITYKAMTFNDEIQKIDTIRAYHVRNFFTLHFVISPLEKTNHSPPHLIFHISFLFHSPRLLLSPAPPPPILQRLP